MSFRHLIAAAFWSFAVTAGAAEAPAAPAAAAATRAGPPAIEDFFVKDEIAGPEVSPSGRYLAAIRKRGEGQAVVVRDRETGAETIVAYTSTERVGFDWLEWKNEQRLLLRVVLFDIIRANGKPDGPILGIRYGQYLEAVDRDGKNLVVMFQNAPSGLQRATARAQFLSPLPNDPGHVLVAAPDGRGMLSVWRADIATGATTLVEPGDWNTIGWFVDRNGAVVARNKVKGKSFVIEGRDARGEWQVMVKLPYKEARELARFEILGPAGKPGEMYVAVKPATAAEGEFRTLHVYDVATRTLSGSKWRALGHDIEAIIYKRGSYDLEGVCFTADVFTCDFADETRNNRYKAVLKAIGPGRNVTINSVSSDGQQWVVGVSGADLPGAYYLYDAPKKDLSLIAEVSPGLAAERLASTRAYAFKSRDGASIPAYLTTPPGAKDGPLPLIVMPHGGPEARDSLQYDRMVQYLATRGYLVFQPQFRGSGGFGQTHAEAGYRQWGLRMQDDVTDGVRDLIDSGRADPARICIVGASYGGYAALIGGALTPELYRCVVSIAGVSDLSALMKWERSRSEDAQDPRYLYWVRSIGDPAVDGAVMKTASAVSHAADYAPPVLLIHGDADDVVPIEQSMLMHKALKRRGRRTRLVVFEDQGHGDFDDHHEKRLYSEIETFLADHIGGAAAPAGAAP